VKRILHIAALIVGSFAWIAWASGEPAPVASPANVPTSGSDEVAARKAMSRTERDLQSSPQLVRDPALNGYMRSVACKVAADDCSRLRLYIVEQPWFNAAMAPDGMVVVWTGALLRMRDEAELAFVLGHEAGHFRAHHVIAPAAYRFSREQEREADRMGFAATVARGYDPQSTVELLARMLREEQARSGGAASSAYAYHPPTRERLADMRADVARLATHGDERNTAAYRAAIHPFLQRWLDAELARRQYAASILVVSELLADASPGDKALLSFYLGEAYRRRGSPSDRSEAARWYAQAVALPDPPAAAWREHGMALRDAGRRREAADALRRYLALAGDAPDRAFVEHDLAGLLEPAQ
jgi:predicted Zn-dependent protease